MLRRRGSGGDGASSAYKMREKMLSIGDDFWIETGSGQRAFFVDGKALRVRETLEIKDPQGTVLLKLKAKLVTIRDVMTIERGDETVATVKKALISPLRDQFTVEFKDGSEWKVQGNIVNHEYEIDGPGGRIAKVSKAWFRIRDTYGVDVAPNNDDAMVLAVAIVVDQMSHDVGR